MVRLVSLLFPFVPLLVSVLVVRLLCLLLSPFVLVIVSALSVTAGALFRWPRSMSIQIHLSNDVFIVLSARFGACTAGVRPVPLATQHFHPFVSHVIPLLLYPWCPPSSAGHAAFLFIFSPMRFLQFCLPGSVPALLGSALFRWICLLLFPRFGTCTAGVRLPALLGPPFSAGHAAFLFNCFSGDFFTFVSQVRCLHFWSVGHAAFLFICLSGAFFTFVSLISLPLSLRFGACTAGVRPLPLAMQHFYSFVR